MTEQKTRHVTPKKRLYRAAFNWETRAQCRYNYERMMDMACGRTLVPVIDDLCKNSPDGAAKRKEVMEREVEFLSVYIEFGSCILRVAIALEGQKSLGEPILGEFITSLKTSLMRPLAGIGDTIYQGVLIPILLAIYIDITLTDTAQRVIVYLVLMLAISHIFGFANFFFGYQQGSKAIMDFLEKGLFDKLLLGTQVIGYMVTGGLIANYVRVSCDLELVTSGPKFSVQIQLFNAVVPGILPSGSTMLVYWLAKERWTSIKVITLIVIIGIIGGLIGILA